MWWFWMEAKAAENWCQNNEEEYELGWTIVKNIYPCKLAVEL